MAEAQQADGSLQLTAKCRISNTQRVPEYPYNEGWEKEWGEKPRPAEGFTPLPGVLVWDAGFFAF
jgi:hypothetical protein